MKPSGKRLNGSRWHGKMITAQNKDISFVADLGPSNYF